MSVLAALLPLPRYSNRVWLYIRSTASLFGSEHTVGFTSSVLAAERLTGHYTMTLALLHLVHQLFRAGGHYEHGGADDELHGDDPGLATANGAEEYRIDDRRPEELE